MRKFTILSVIGLAALLPSPAFAPALAQAATTPPLVPPSIMAKWNKVAWCESHGNWTQVHWGAQAFSGALGIKNYVWLANGGRQFGPTAGHASPEEQVLVARQIQRSAGFGEYVPDQDGQCRGW